MREFESTEPRRGYWSWVLVGFLPAAFFAHFWAYLNLAGSAQAAYASLLFVVYLAPLLLAALIVGADRAIRRRLRRRYASVQDSANPRERAAAPDDAGAGDSAHHD